MTRSEQEQHFRDKARAAGARCGELGIALTRNPHYQDDPLHTQWLLGCLDDVEQYCRARRAAVREGRAA